ncbi:hypothetical protein GCM10028806_51860 [Spirosoma terrae]|uniref:Uncharacterized protein n=1 Tax=Spirosoma terrae TaxID=1968276 RepID=A0A6L9LBK1_9BACT|nr:hypothetical protein [Spirosoma terrae]NDU96541.1 hypothetical protein [Spirosoma terrae]
MVITRDNNKIIIQAVSSINMDAVQRLIDYINVLEITANNQGTEEQAAALADEIDRNWWAENKKRFLK